MKKMDHTKPAKVPFFTSFYRSQMTSIIATAIDFAIFIFLKDLCAVYYVAASAIGACCGAIVSFFLGRNWAFRRKDGRMSMQAVKYVMTSVTSLLLNTYGIYALTEFFEISPLYSKIIISILVGAFFNFFMYRYFVYR